MAIGLTAFACAADSETEQTLPTLRPLPTYTALPTQAPLPTVVPLPTLAPLPTHAPLPTLIPLPTLLPNPTYTPFPTHTPLPPLTSTPMPTPMTEFGEGVYRVGVDILAGTYRKVGNDSCYWARLSGFSGELADVIANDIANDNVQGPGIVTIQPSDNGFESTRCGIWTRVGD